jgi:glycosyltransferase involved in cell wall biosynthesis
MDKTKRLLIINSSYPIELKENSLVVRDGSSSYSIAVATGLKDTYRTTILSPGPEDSFVYGGISFLAWGGQSRSQNKVGNLDFWRKIVQFVLKNDFDLIMVHSGISFFLSVISDILPAYCVGIIHDTYPENFGLLINFGRDIWMKSARRLDLVLSSNEYTCRHLIEKYKHKPQKVHCTGNGVDIQHFTVPPVKEDLIVFIGRFVRSKGVLELLQGAGPWLKENRGARLVLIGNGILYPALTDYVAKNQLDGQVEILTGLNDRQKIAQLQKAKVYVSLSQYEGFGIPLVEGMACGAVPVVSDIPAHRFVFQDKDVGFLVKDSKELIAKVDFLWKNEAARRELAFRGRRLVEEVWTWEKMNERCERALTYLRDKDLSSSPAQKIKRPVKIGLLKALISFLYFFLVRKRYVRFANDGN